MNLAIGAPDIPRVRRSESSPFGGLGVELEPTRVVSDQESDRDESREDRDRAKIEVEYMFSCGRMMY